MSFIELYLSRRSGPRQLVRGRNDSYLVDNSGG